MDTPSCDYISHCVHRSFRCGKNNTYCGQSFSTTDVEQTDIDSFDLTVAQKKPAPILKMYFKDEKIILCGKCVQWDLSIYFMGWGNMAVNGYSKNLV